MLNQVDLGTKQGGALEVFHTRYTRYFDRYPDGKFSRGNCIGYDRNDTYKAEVTRRGFQFVVLDLSTNAGLQALPQADYYTAFNFLEHLPSREWSSVVVKRALDRAQKGCWFRLPSFEQEHGEAILKEHGLRFAWTNWKGHPSHYTLADLSLAVADWREANPKCKATLDISMLPDKVETTLDRRVVPIDAPIDTVKYHASLGPKVNVKLTPIPVEFECIVRLTK